MCYNKDNKERDKYIERGKENETDSLLRIQQGDQQERVHSPQPSQMPRVHQQEREQRQLRNHLQMDEHLMKE